MRVLIATLLVTFVVLATAKYYNPYALQCSRATASYRASISFRTKAYESLRRAQLRYSQIVKSLNAARVTIQNSQRQLVLAQRREQQAKIYGASICKKARLASRPRTHRHRHGKRHFHHGKRHFHHGKRHFHHGKRHHRHGRRHRHRHGRRHHHVRRPRRHVRATISVRHVGKIDATVDDVLTSVKVNGKALSLRNLPSLNNWRVVKHFTTNLRRGDKIEISGYNVGNFSGNNPAVLAATITYRTRRGTRAIVTSPRWKCNGKPARSYGLNRGKDNIWMRNFGRSIAMSTNAHFIWDQNPTIRAATCSIVLQ